MSELACGHLILIRHGHRDLSDRSADNGLSKKGKAQSRKILDHFKRSYRKKTRVLLVSSPKRRCIETVEPIARYFGCEIGIREELGEQKALESPEAFRSRISRALRKLGADAKAPRSATLVVCSHGDWIPAAIEQLCGARADVKKGGLVEFEDGALMRLLQPSDL